MNIRTLGIDLAKHVFRLHGVDRSGKLVVARQLRWRQIDAVHRAAETLFGGDGSLRWRASLFGAAIGEVQ